MTDCRDAKLLQGLVRQAGRTVSSISFSRNAASYFPRPRLRSQTTMSMMRPTSVVACIICRGSEGVQGGVGFSGHRKARLGLSAMAALLAIFEIRRWGVYRRGRTCVFRKDGTVVSLIRGHRFR